MIAVQDTTAALVAYLLAQPVVTSLVGSRVYGLELPADETRHMPRAALVLTPSGGVSAGYTQSLPLEGSRFDAYCYAATPHEAQALRRSVRAAMRALSRVRIGTTLLHWVQPAGGYSASRDAQTDWPRVWESYSVLASETPA